MYLIVILILLTIDIPYFVIAFTTYVIGRYFKSKLDIKGVSAIYNLCWPWHLDYMLHMNNAKYYREMDHGRADYLSRTRLFEEIRKKGFSFAQNAAQMRFRRSLNPFQPFKLQTKLVYFDSRAFYLEQRFVSMKDNFIHAVAYNKNTMIGCDDCIKFFKYDIIALS